METEDELVISFKIVRDVDEILPLRHRVLLNGLDIETARFDDDKATSTWHFAGFAIDENHNHFGEPICCVSYMLNQHEHDLAWQLRGMAVDTPYQNRGFGRQMLKITEQCLLARVGMRTLWCNARLMAVPFYETNGWECRSDVFELSPVGPHRKMVRHNRSHA